MPKNTIKTRLIAFSLSFVVSFVVARCYRNKKQQAQYMALVMSLPTIEEYTDHNKGGLAILSD